MQKTIVDQRITLLCVSKTSESFTYNTSYTSFSSHEYHFSICDSLKNVEVSKCAGKSDFGLHEQDYQRHGRSGKNKVGSRFLSHHADGTITIWQQPHRDPRPPCVWCQQCRSPWWRSVMVWLIDVLALH